MAVDACVQLHSNVQLAVIGDVHARMSVLARVLQWIDVRRPDGILLVGDLGRGLGRGEPTDKRRERYRKTVAKVLDAVRALGLPVAWVPGNHDLPDWDPEVWPGNLDYRTTTIAGLRVAGIGGAGPHRFGFAYEWDEDDIRARTVPPCDVLLSHCPPARTALDFVPNHKVHAGSEAVRELALRHQGFLVCGHIHESPAVEILGNCLCMNVGGLGYPYGRAQVGLITREPGCDRALHYDFEDNRERHWERRYSSELAGS